MASELTYSVPKIHCDGCAQNIRVALEPVEGVESTEVDVNTKTVKVRGAAADAVVRKVLASAGYPPA